MPISQHRMLTLISASREFQMLFDKLIVGSEEIFRQVLADQIDLATGYQLLINLKHSLRPSNEAIQVITAEAVHFKHAARKNELTKARMRRKRAGTAMGQANIVSHANLQALAEDAGLSAPESMVPQGVAAAMMQAQAQTPEYKAEPSLRYAPPSAEQIEDASRAAFIAKSEEIRRQLREGTFGREDEPEVESETEEDPEGYAGDVEGEDF